MTTAKTVSMRARYMLEFKQEAVRLATGDWRQAAGGRRQAAGGRRPEHRGGGSHVGAGGPDAIQLGQD